MTWRTMWTWNDPSGRRRLVAANVALLALLVVFSLVTPVGAQSGQPAARARGEYTMVAGRVNSGGSSVVYVVDSNNQEVVALKWDSSRQTMTGLGYRKLSADGQAAPGR